MIHDNNKFNRDIGLELPGCWLSMLRANHPSGYNCGIGRGGGLWGLEPHNFEALSHKVISHMNNFNHIKDKPLEPPPLPTNTETSSYTTV